MRRFNGQYDSPELDANQIDHSTQFFKVLEVRFCCLQSGLVKN